jgi:hypothetical protein
VSSLWTAVGLSSDGFAQYDFFQIGFVNFRFFFSFRLAFKTLYLGGALGAHHYPTVRRARIDVAQVAIFASLPLDL